LPLKLLGGSIVWFGTVVLTLTIASLLSAYEAVSPDMLIFIKLEFLKQNHLFLGGSDSNCI
jgi:hypothetical protein